MQVGTELGGVGPGGVGTALGVAVEVVAKEAREASTRLGEPTAKAAHPSDLAVDAHRLEHAVGIGEIDLARQLEPVRRMPGAQPRHGVRPVLEVTLDLRANRARGVLGLARCEPDRHDDVALDLQHADRTVRGEPLPPVAQVPKVGGVDDDQGRPSRERERRLGREGASADEAHAEICQPLGRLGEPLEHEREVPLARLGVVVHQREQRDDGLAERVGLQDRPVQRRVVVGTLGGLHPVEDVVARFVDGSVVQGTDRGVVGRHSEAVRGRGKPRRERCRGEGDIDARITRKREAKL